LCSSIPSIRSSLISSIEASKGEGLKATYTHILHTIWEFFQSAFEPLLPHIFLIDNQHNSKQVCWHLVFCSFLPIISLF
jgi:hypothetical protein